MNGKMIIIMMVMMMMIPPPMHSSPSLFSFDATLRYGDDNKDDKTMMITMTTMRNQPPLTPLVSFWDAIFLMVSSMIVMAIIITIEMHDNSKSSVKIWTPASYG